MFEKASEAAALRWRFVSVPDESERHVTISFVFTAKQNDAPVEEYQQKAQREVVVKGPLELEVIEAPYVCYMPGGEVVRRVRKQRGSPQSPR
jgi:hypothetical protein